MNNPDSQLNTSGIEQTNGFSEQKELMVSFLWLFIPASLLLASIFYAFSTQTQQYELQTTLIRDESALKSAGELTSLLFEQKLSDLLVLAEGEVLKNYLHDESMKNWIRVAREFSLFARRKPKYFQIRFIATNGMEVLRINNSDDTQQIVPKNELQDKSSRYYFQESIKLEEGGIYVSPLDLNKEKGVIEKPIRPTIRFATPVFDGYGEKRGILIINYTPDELLHRIAENFKSLHGDTVMLNSSGFWLVGAPDEQLWGFMYGSDMTFAKQRPDVWAAISSSEKGTFLSDDGIFIFHKAYPLDRGKLGTVENIEMGVGVSKGRLGDRYWIYLSHISTRLIDELSAKRMIIATVTYLMLFLVTGLISVFFAKNSVQKKLAFLKLQQYATTDGLTGLANRRELDKFAIREFKRAKRFTRRLSVLMLDLDHFKQVNDTYDHTVGDKVLRHIAGICGDAIRAQDFLARYGGEEFTILLPETDIEGAAQLGQRICDNVAITPCQVGQTEIKITVSIGASEIEIGDEVFHDVLLRADKALYEAKKRGRNRVVVSSEGYYLSSPACLSDE
ncbi:MAG: sensor domain-containing diguanylate cyclase [Candidatus Thiodiazotropha sp. (ex Lucinoma borealis)]|nr:sensor domain-containing diguanylate cyclase [Candidatus Thiodiazotropha sp. (ex Lucinoma borealis)]MCU7868734.1 sensor domain-containing diguanylate cyclase [Candidatus Thiodiazotropha sp. (ex Lucinoma borealis)]